MRSRLPAVVLAEEGTGALPLLLSVLQPREKNAALTRRRKVEGEGSQEDEGGAEEAEEVALLSAPLTAKEMQHAQTIVATSPGDDVVRAMLFLAEAHKQRRRSDAGGAEKEDAMLVIGSFDSMQPARIVRAAWSEMGRIVGAICGDDRFEVASDLLNCPHFFADLLLVLPSLALARPRIDLASWTEALLYAVDTVTLSGSDTSSPETASAVQYVRVLAMNRPTRYMDIVAGLVTATRATIKAISAASATSSTATAAAATTAATAVSDTASSGISNATTTTTSTFTVDNSKLAKLGRILRRCEHTIAALASLGAEYATPLRSMLCHERVLCGQCVQITASSHVFDATRWINALAPASPADRARMAANQFGRFSRRSIAWFWALLRRQRENANVLRRQVLDTLMAVQEATEMDGDGKEHARQSSAHIASAGRSVSGMSLLTQCRALAALALRTAALPCSPHHSTLSADATGTSKQLTTFSNHVQRMVERLATQEAADEHARDAVHAGIAVLALTFLQLCIAAYLADRAHRHALRGADTAAAGHGNAAFDAGCTASAPAPHLPPQQQRQQFLRGQRERNEYFADEWLASSSSSSSSLSSWTATGGTGLVPGPASGASVAPAGATNRAGALAPSTGSGSGAGAAAMPLQSGPEPGSTALAQQRGRVAPDERTVDEDTLRMLTATTERWAREEVGTQQHNDKEGDSDQSGDHASPPAVTTASGGDNLPADSLVTSLGVEPLAAMIAKVAVCMQEATSLSVVASSASTTYGVALTLALLRGSTARVCQLLEQALFLSLPRGFRRDLNQTLHERSGYHMIQSLLLQPLLWNQLRSVSFAQRLPASCAHPGDHLVCLNELWAWKRSVSTLNADAVEHNDSDAAPAESAFSGEVDSTNLPLHARPPVLQAIAAATWPAHPELLRLVRSFADPKRLTNPGDPRRLTVGAKAATLSGAPGQRIVDALPGAFSSSSVVGSSRAGSGSEEEKDNLAKNGSDRAASRDDQSAGDFDRLNTIPDSLGVLCPSDVHYFARRVDWGRIWQKFPAAAVPLHQIAGLWTLLLRAAATHMRMAQGSDTADCQVGSALANTTEWGRQRLDGWRELLPRQVKQHAEELPNAKSHRRRAIRPSTADTAAAAAAYAVTEESNTVKRADTGGTVRAGPAARRLARWQRRALAALGLASDHLPSASAYGASASDVNVAAWVPVVQWLLRGDPLSRQQIDCTKLPWMVEVLDAAAASATPSDMYGSMKQRAAAHGTRTFIAVRAALVLNGLLRGLLRAGESVLSNAALRSWIENVVDKSGFPSFAASLAYALNYMYLRRPVAVVALAGTSPPGFAYQFRDLPVRNLLRVLFAADLVLDSMQSSWLAHLLPLTHYFLPELFCPERVPSTFLAPGLELGHSHQHLSWLRCMGRDAAPAPTISVADLITPAAVSEAAVAKYAAAVMQWLSTSCLVHEPDGQGDPKASSVATCSISAAATAMQAFAPASSAPAVAPVPAPAPPPAATAESILSVLSALRLAPYCTGIGNICCSFLGLAAQGVLLHTSSSSSSPSDPPAGSVPEVGQSVVARRWSDAELQGIWDLWQHVHSRDAVPQRLERMAFVAMLAGADTPEATRDGSCSGGRRSTLALEQCTYDVLVQEPLGLLRTPVALLYDRSAPFMCILLHVLRPLLVASEVEASLAATLVRLRVRSSKSLSADRQLARLRGSVDAVSMVSPTAFSALQDCILVRSLLHISAQQVAVTPQSSKDGSQSGMFESDRMIVRFVRQVFVERPELGHILARQGLSTTELSWFVGNAPDLLASICMFTVEAACTHPTPDFLLFTTEAVSTALDVPGADCDPLLDQLVEVALKVISRLTQFVYGATLFFDMHTRHAYLKRVSDLFVHIVRQFPWMCRLVVSEIEDCFDLLVGTQTAASHHRGKGQAVDLDPRVFLTDLRTAVDEARLAPVVDMQNRNNDSGGTPASANAAAAGAAGKATAPPKHGAQKASTSTKATKPRKRPRQTANPAKSKRGKMTKETT